MVLLFFWAMYEVIADHGNPRWLLCICCCFLANLMIVLDRTQFTR
jgi:hypothetical protein